MASRPGQATEPVDRKDMRRAETVEKAHGRIETRRIAVRPIPSRLDRDWPGATQIVRLERLRELKDRCSRQIVYAITSIPTGAIDPEQMLALARAHWQIENRLFRVRDGTFAEDLCRVRTGNAPAALAHLRDASLTLIRKRKHKPKPAREAFAANPKAAIRAILRA
ncbi:ISAs1 family transposase [Mesorhizobium sp. LHD-90]|uniref:ISAs1 family transposase n=1 Tax=Mesorhizobium sp. LHD-90 TaxID=3071414 RepID=UPI0027DF1B6D|nr:ISAs1 family transposase [Mesorhizobium sp. LHD-90]MDQ6436840.1 ISAs1 family transposase [Mesorhizobium sp. LHD-90]